jgi:hypothetical protein
MGRDKRDTFLLCPWKKIRERVAAMGRFKREREKERCSSCWTPWSCCNILDCGEAPPRAVGNVLWEINFLACRADLDFLAAAVVFWCRLFFCYRRQSSTGFGVML